MLNCFPEELKILFIELLVHHISCGSQKKNMKQHKNINYSLCVDSRKNEKVKNRITIYM